MGGIADAEEARPRPSLKAVDRQLSCGLLVSLVLLFIVMFLVLRVLLTIVRVVGTLALLRLLVLLAMFVLGFALLVFCHRDLLLIDTVRGVTVSEKKDLIKWRLK